MNRALLVVCAQNLLIFSSITGGRVLITLYALHQGASSAEVGLVIAMMFVAPAVLSWPVGVLMKRVGPARILIWGAAVAAAGMLAPCFWPNLFTLGIGSLGIGVGVALSTVVGQNLVGELSTPETRMRNFSNYALVGGAANFLGPLLIGLAIDHAGFTPSCALLVASSVVAAGIVAAGNRLLPRGKAQQKKTGGMMPVLREPKSRRVLVISVFAQMGVDAFTTFMPVYAHQVGLSASMIGAALSTMAVAMVLARLAIPRVLRGRKEEAVMMAAFLIGAAPAFALPFFEAAWAFAALAFLFGLFMGINQPMMMQLIYTTSPPGRSGEALGLRLSINNVTRMVTPMVLGVTARAFGLMPVFFSCGALMCAGARLCQLLEEPAAAGKGSP